MHSCFFYRLEPISDKRHPQAGNRIKVKKWFYPSGERKQTNEGLGTLTEFPSRANQAWMNVKLDDGHEMCVEIDGKDEWEYVEDEAKIPDIGRIIRLHDIFTPDGESVVGRVHSTEVKVNLDNHLDVTIVVRGLDGDSEYCLSDAQRESWEYVEDKEPATGGWISDFADSCDFPTFPYSPPMTVDIGPFNCKCAIDCPYTHMFGLPATEEESTYKPYTLSKGGSIMSKLSLLAKKVFDKDTKTLIKAGVLDTDLNVQNHQFVLSFVVEQYKKEMAALAQEQLDEAKADC